MNSDRKVAIVTGGGTGVGAATSLWLAKRGFNVLINFSKSVTESASAATACESAGTDAVAVQGNVAEDADCRRIVQTAVSHWGRLDALVKNAATTVFVPAWKLEDIHAVDFDRI